MPSGMGGRGGGLFCVMGNGAPCDTKVSGGRRTLRKGKWLLAQPRSGAGVCCRAHFLHPERLEVEGTAPLCISC